MPVDLRPATVDTRDASPSLPAAPAGYSGYRSGMMGLWDLRQLISIMVRRDLLGRYRGSMMGAFWTVINPVGHLLLYTFVFSIILKVRFGTDASTSNFALYLMAGLLPWGALSESLLRATTAILEQPNLVKRVVFPLEILPFVCVISSFLSELVSVAVLVVASSIYTHTVHWTLVFLPLIMLSQLAFTAGVSWLLASLGVYIQDIRHVISLALSVWMYATPIVYPASAFPAKLHFLTWVNPIAGIVTDYRRILLEGLPPVWTSYAYYTAVALTVWCIGYWFFHKTKRSFADVM